ncbi:ABC transporter ATP-binding protein/permease [Paenisporosarcina quisquiliarum]|uniref:ABC transporter ATP-binding protein/permease n=1 Tax=Paenisporosarcina quisquiliarum TaxID=365346 RepID=A0A9X3LF40_9BACL|nr:ABC transporter ATP-binding protein [Paenisporosarcina quisquiliarum]MCZ8536758.1 ABC transporter ATP-binding protein/permease [Paenisporosarcina quisquiliarum]
MKTNNTSSKQFFQLIRSLNWPIGVTIFAVFLALAETITGLIIPLVTKNLVDSLTTAIFDWRLISLLFVVFILQAIAGGVSYYLLSFIGETIVADLRKKLWRKVLRLPVPYFDTHETGETMSRITQDTSTLKQLITGHLVTFVSGIISVIGSVILLFFIDWKMTLIMLVSVPLSMAIIIPLGRKMHKVAKGTQEEMAKFSGLLGRVLSDIRLVKAYRAEETESGKGDQAVGELFQFGLKEAKIQSIISPVMTLIMMGILVIILGYGGMQVSNGNLSAGSLVAIIFYLFQIVVPFAQMASFFTAYQKAVGATERIQGMLELNNETISGSPQINKEPLRFEHIHFSYSEEKKILTNVSFESTPGTVTAFVGPSGGGKTTIFSLLERFYEPDSGAIFIGQTAIKDLPLGDWRGRIGYVSQESPLMSGSILDNMAYGLEVRPSLEQIKEAAIAANAWEFIEKLPQGFETLVGERGMKLSGGQRQRIAIARALLYNPQILLLDEATSNLDSGSEILVQEALQLLMEGRTTLIIAHRLATVLHADQIIVLEGGQITGTGTHSELFASHKLYKEFALGQGLS